jgi:hypothetical protein
VTEFLCKIKIIKIMIFFFRYCLDRVTRGGPGLLRKCCKLRKCSRLVVKAHDRDGDVARPSRSIESSEFTAAGSRSSAPSSEFIFIGGFLPISLHCFVLAYDSILTEK